MVNLRRVEDRPTPEAVYNWRVWVLAGTAACASMVIGYDSAFIGGTMALKSFTNEFGMLSATTSANVVSTYQAGAFFGSLCGYPLGYFFGRKWGLFLAAVVFCVGSGVMCSASQHTGLGPMYAGRVLAGGAIGSASNLAPMYIAEIAPSSIRGQLVGLYELGWQIGGIIGFWINFSVDRNMVSSHRQWLIPFAIQLVPGGLLLVGSLTLIESPRWLLERRNKQAAMRNLCKIRHLPPSHPYVIEEMSAMETQLEREQALVGTSFWGPFRETFLVGNVLRRVLLGASLFAFQNGSGINAVNYYSPTIFESIGITGTSTSLLTTGVFGIIKTIGAIVWILFFIDHFGRRIILMTGSVGGALSMYWIGAYIKIADVKNRAPSSGLSGGGISALAAFYIWTAFYSTSWNGTPWVVGAEIFPQQSRTLGQACISASNWLFNFAIARATPQMFANMDYGVYMFFASFMVLAIPYIYIILPETKGIPLEAMNELFDAPVPYRKAHAWMIEKMADTCTQKEGGQQVIVDEKMFIEERSEDITPNQV